MLYLFYNILYTVRPNNYANDASVSNSVVIYFGLKLANLSLIIQAYSSIITRAIEWNNLSIWVNKGNRYMCTS